MYKITEKQQQQIIIITINKVEIDVNNVSK